MNELIAKIEATLAENNGIMPYTALLETLTEKEKRELPNALKEGKRQQKIRKRLTWNTETKQNDLVVGTFAALQSPEQNPEVEG